MTIGLPLAGKRIVITRPRAHAGALAEKLAALGAEPILLPMIEIAPVDDYGPLDAALDRLDQYQWIAFTSGNAVAIFWERLSGRLPASPQSAGGPSLQFAAVGPATARELQKHGVTAQVIPDEYVAEALAASMGEVTGQRVLLPQAELAREVLADELRQRGAAVDEIAVYRTLPAVPDPQGLAELRRGVDAVTFTSASAARNFARVLKGAPAEAPRPAIACIGPVTAAGAREAGLAVDVVATEYTLVGLVAALAGYFAQPRPQ